MVDPESDAEETRVLEPDRTRFESDAKEPGDATRTAGGTPAAPPADVPESIGAYRILGKLGEGGMGIVFEAEQQSPRRTVALKVVRGGHFVDETHVRMFQREADTLARLKHSNIAAIYESGRTDDGQHFFAMELVRGETLDSYLAKRSRTTTQHELRFRLALFRKIADAVHYAHQRGVIHRDLKPSNIIVGEDVGLHDRTGASTLSGLRLPEIKILDFGLARITERDLTAATMTTEVGVIKGTLPYMSPEQARGDSDQIDIRTDVYALGVILYEMLTGRRPYDVLNKSLVEAVRVIGEEPPRPLRQSGVPRLEPDVETIVAKALQKEAERRYASAAALSEDVARYLTSQPILARPPSTTYQIRKFAGRHKALVGGTVATFVVLLAGIVVSATFGVREATQRREAERARNDLESVVEFQAGMLGDVNPEELGQLLMKDLLERMAVAARAASPDQAASVLRSFESALGQINPTDVALRVIDEDILSHATERIESEFGEQPLIAAQLFQTLGRTFRQLGLNQRAELHVRRALELREPLLGQNHLDTLRSKHELVYLAMSQQRYDEAEKLARAVWETGRLVHGDEHPETLSAMDTLSYVWIRQQRYDEAERLVRRALETARRALGEDDLRTLSLIHGLAHVLQYQERFDEAARSYEEVIDGNRRLLGAEHRNTLDSMNNLGNVFASQGRYDEAEKLHRTVLEVRQRIFGNDHPDTRMAFNNLANVYHQQRRYDDVAGLDRQSVAILCSGKLVTATAGGPPDGPHEGLEHALRQRDGEWQVFGSQLDRSGTSATHAGKGVYIWFDGKRSLCGILHIDVIGPDGQILNQLRIQDRYSVAAEVPTLERPNGTYLGEWDPLQSRVTWRLQNPPPGVSEGKANKLRV